MEEINQPITPTQTPDQMHSSFENSRNSKVIPFVIVAVLLVLVGVGSYILGTKSSQPATENKVVSQPSPTPIPPTSTPDPTANWQTFKGTFFDLKYPNDWVARINPIPYTVDVSKPGETNMVASRVDDQNLEQLSDRVASLFWKTPNVEQVIVKQITVDGENATEYFGCAGIEGCVNQYIIVVKHNNNLFKIDFIPYSSQEKEIYSQILSTFKFTE